MYSVAVQLKTLIADGIATRKLRIEKISAGVDRLARDEQVMPPDQEAEHRDRQAGERDEAVAEDRACARTPAISSLTTPMRRQHHDVDGRMRVEPEQVLEQDRVAAERGIEDADVQHALQAPAAPA